MVPCFVPELRDCVGAIQGSPLSFNRFEADPWPESAAASRAEESAVAALPLWQFEQPEAAQYHFELLFIDSSELLRCM